jgi:hypothetical protein
MSGRIVAAWLLGAALFGAAPRPSVLIFVRTDCPISNRYAPELQRLYAAYRARADFQLVYVEPGLTAQQMHHHQAEFALGIPAVLDTDGSFVRKAAVTVTPEAVVFVEGKLVYRGRIDDRYVSLSTARPAALHHDLEDAILAVLAGKAPPAAITRAIGCAIEQR